MVALFGVVVVQLAGSDKISHKFGDECPAGRFKASMTFAKFPFSKIQIEKTKGCQAPDGWRFVSDKDESLYRGLQHLLFGQLKKKTGYEFETEDYATLKKD